MKSPAIQKRRAAAFIDRDGTVIRNAHYLSDPEAVELLPGAAAALRRLQQAGYLLILVSNQSGLARGYFSPADLQAVHRRLEEELAAAGVVLDGYYYCPHGPDDPDCHCRKPAVGMLAQACRDFAIDLGHAVVIGDSACDVQLGHNFALPAVQIQAAGADVAEGADFVCCSLEEAVTWWLQRERQPAPPLQGQGEKQLELYFHDIRSHLLEAAAGFDRLQRLGGVAEDDPRLQALRQAAAIAADRAPERARRLLEALSDV